MPSPLCSAQRADNKHDGPDQAADDGPGDDAPDMALPGHGLLVGLSGFVKLAQGPLRTERATFTALGSSKPRERRGSC